MLDADEGSAQLSWLSLRIFRLQKKKIPTNIAITATGTTTPIAALAPVDKPVDPDEDLEVVEAELVFVVDVWVGVGADRSLLCH